MYGAIITVLFLAAIVVLTYRRLGLLAFCCTLTVLLVVYCYLAPPAPVWKSLLWIFTALLWLLNLMLRVFGNVIAYGLSAVFQLLSSCL